MIKNLKKKYNTILNFVFPLILIFIGFVLHKDYGISSDEEITRNNGLVSIKYIYNFLLQQYSFNLEIIKNVPDLKNYSDRQYGSFLEIIQIAVIEILFGIKNFAEVFYYRHLSNHYLFVASIITFYFLCLDLIHLINYLEIIVN